MKRNPKHSSKSTMKVSDSKTAPATVEVEKDNSAHPEENVSFVDQVNICLEGLKILEAASQTWPSQFDQLVGEKYREMKSQMAVVCSSMQAKQEQLKEKSQQSKVLKSKEEGKAKKRKASIIEEDGDSKAKKPKDLSLGTSNLSVAVDKPSNRNIFFYKNFMKKTCIKHFPLFYATYKIRNLDESPNPKPSIKHILAEQVKLYFPSSAATKPLCLSSYQEQYRKVFGEKKLHLLPAGDLHEPLSPNHTESPPQYVPTAEFIKYYISQCGKVQKKIAPVPSNSADRLEKLMSRPLSENDFGLAFRVIGTAYAHRKQYFCDMEKACRKTFPVLYATYKVRNLEGLNPKPPVKHILDEQLKLYFPNSATTERMTLGYCEIKYSKLFGKKNLHLLPAGDLHEPLSPNQTGSPPQYMPTAKFIEYYYSVFIYQFGSQDPTLPEGPKISGKQMKSLVVWAEKTIAQFGLSSDTGAFIPWNDAEYTEEDKAEVLPYLTPELIQIHEDYGRYTARKDVAFKIIREANVPSGKDTENGLPYLFGVLPKSRGTYSLSGARVYAGVATIKNWNFRMNGHKYEIHSASKSKNNSDENRKYKYFAAQVKKGHDIFHNPLLRCFPRLSLNCLFLVEYLIIAYLKRFPWSNNILKGCSRKFASTLGATIPQNIAEELGCALLLYSFKTDVIPETEPFVPGNHN